MNTPTPSTECPHCGKKAVMSAKFAKTVYLHLDEWQDSAITRVLNNPHVHHICCKCWEEVQP